MKYYQLSKIDGWFFVSALAAEWIEISVSFHTAVPFPVSALAAEWIEIVTRLRSASVALVSALAAEWIEIPIMG